MSIKTKYIYVILGIAAIAACAVLGIRYAFLHGYIRMNHPSPAEYPVQGIDVSHHQKAIDWKALDRQQVQFAFIKATEGITHKDSLFASNWQQAKERRIARSAYHYFSFCKSGREQAANFISTVPRDSTDMAPAIDLEFGGNCMPENRFADILKEVQDYIAIVENHYNKRVIIYTTYDFYDAYLHHQFTENPVWIRDILNKPKLKDGRVWVFWQYANRGNLEGIGTPVDLNVFHGSRNEFDTFVSAGITE